MKKESIDITGQKFAKLTAIRKDHRDTKYGWVWLFKCDCGNEILRYSFAVKGLHIKSCGCLSSPDITGKKFGKLTVLNKHHKNKQNSWVCQCKCDCGNTTYVTVSNLNAGNVKSCGCIVGKSNIKHGLCESKIYKKHRGMKERCFNKKCSSYKNYGGRGIIMCDEWRNDFMSFYNWAMDNGYKEGLSLERIDVNGNYCPENCTWIPLREQGKNKRSNIRIKFMGKEYILADLSKNYSIPYEDLHRIYCQEKDVEKYVLSKIKDKNLKSMLNDNKIMINLYYDIRQKLMEIITNKNEKIKISEAIDDVIREKLWRDDTVIIPT